MNDQQRRQLGDALTRRFVDFIDNGMPATDQNGDPVLDENGNQKRIPPSAAMMSAAHKWFNEMSKGDNGGDEQDPVAATIARLQKGEGDSGGQMPPVDEEAGDPAGT